MFAGFVIMFLSTISEYSSGQRTNGYNLGCKQKLPWWYQFLVSFSCTYI